MLTEGGIPKGGTRERNAGRMDRLEAFADAICEIDLEFGFVTMLNAVLREVAIMVGG